MTTTVSTQHPRHGFEREYPFASHYRKIDDRDYHYLDEGDGEVLLMVHGNPTWSFAWRNLIKELSPDFRTIAVDHIGCGFSEKPQTYPYQLAQHVDNLCEFIQLLDLQQVTLIAHDWGGAIGMGAAVRMPQRFSKFVLCNTAAFRSRRIPLRISTCRIPFVGSVAVRGLNLFSRAALMMAVENPSRLTPEIRAGYLAPYRSWKDRVAVLRFVQDIPLRASHPSYNTLREIEYGSLQFQQHPMLLVWGMRDWCFTPRFLEEFQRRFPDAKTLPLENAGHYVFEDAADELIAGVRTFCGQPAGVTGSR